MSKKWLIAGVAAVCFMTGVALSHRIERVSRVEKVTLAENHRMRPSCINMEVAG